MSLESKPNLKSPATVIASGMEAERDYRRSLPGRASSQCKGSAMLCRLQSDLHNACAQGSIQVVDVDGAKTEIVAEGVHFRLAAINFRRKPEGWPKDMPYRIPERGRTNAGKKWLIRTQRAIFDTDPAKWGTEEHPIPLGYFFDDNDEPYVFYAIPDFVSAKFRAFGFSEAFNILTVTIPQTEAEPEERPDVPRLLIYKLRKDLDGDEQKKDDK